MEKTEAPKPVVFFVMHETDETLDETVSSGDLIVIDMPGNWKLGYVKKEKFDEFRDQHETFGVMYSARAKELSFGFVDPDLEVISLDKCNRFYANPTSAHFCGLMMGWSTVSSNGLNSSSLDWTRVEEDCWHGDINSVILNLLMPREHGGVCGCGNNELATQAVARLLTTQMNHPIYTTDEQRSEALQDYLYGVGELQDAMLFIAYLVDALGFTEHGSSVFHGWLTGKGVYLAFLMEESALESNRYS